VGTLNLAIFERGIMSGNSNGSLGCRQKWASNPMLPPAMRSEVGAIAAGPGQFACQFALATRCFMGIIFQKARGDGSGRCDLHYQMKRITTRSRRVPVRPERAS